VQAFPEQRAHLRLGDRRSACTVHTFATVAAGTQRAPVDCSDASPQPTQRPGDSPFAV
jgi:hypothetical protein